MYALASSPAGGPDRFSSAPGSRAMFGARVGLDARAGRVGRGLFDLVGVRPGEGRLVALLLLLGLCGSMATALARTAAFSIFVVDFGADRLPIVYIGLGLVSALVSTLYLRAAGRLPLGQVLIGAYALAAAAFVAVRVGLATTGTTVALFGLPIAWGVLNVLTYMTFWNIAGRLFDLRQGKRLFPLLSVTDPIGAIAIGLVAPRLVVLAGVAELITLAAVLLLATLGILGLLLLIARGPFGIQPRPTPDRAPEVPSRAGRRYLGLLFFVVAINIVSAYFIDSIFYAQLDATLGTTEAVAAFVGRFFAGIGALSLLMQIFVAGPLIRRRGVLAVVLVTPVVLGTGTLAFAVIATFADHALAPVFWLAVAINLARGVLDGLDITAVNILYQPLPKLARTRAQTIVDGILYPLGIAFAGALLLGLRSGLGLGQAQVAWILLALVGCWLAGAIALARAYPALLSEALPRLPRSGATIAPARAHPRLAEVEFLDVLAGEIDALIRLTDRLAAPGADFAARREALAGEIARGESRVFHLLALRYDPETMRAIEVGLRSPETDRRAHALEMLELSVAPKVSRTLLPFFDASPPRRAAGGE